MDNKEAPQPEEIKSEAAEELDSAELDEAHGGLSFGRDVRTVQRLGHTLRPVPGNNLNVDVDACCTVYGGTSGMPTPLKR